MRQTKTILANYALFDRSGIRRFLEKQAMKGWRLSEQRGACWRFTRMEPKALRYDIAFFPLGSDDGEETNAVRQEFEEFCARDGWRFVSRFGSMHVFVNEHPNPTPLETDPQVELTTVCNAVKKGYQANWILVLVLLAVILVGLCWLENSVSPFSVRFFSCVYVYQCIALVMMILLNCCEQTLFAIWKSRTRSSIALGGGFVETRSFPLLSLLTLPLMILCYAGMFVDLVYSYAEDPLRISDWKMYLFWTIVLLKVGSMMKDAFFPWKKNSSPRKKTSGKNAWGSLVVLLLALAIALVSNVVLSFIGAKDVRRYELNGQKYTLHSDDIPISLDDLVATEYEDYSYELLSKEETVFMSSLEAAQTPRVDRKEEPSMNYQLVTTAIPALQQLVLEDLIDGEIRYVPADAAAWGAEAVYAAVQEGKEQAYCYLVSMEGMLFKLQTSWQLSYEQMEKLGKLLVELNR